MDFLTQLWLPILVSGVVVWIASAIFWMAIGHHNKDRDTLPAGADRELMATISRLNIAPGSYSFPDFSQVDKSLPPKERRAAQKALYNTHPQGLLRVWRPINMGRNMALTFLFYLVSSTVIAYLAWAALPHGATFAKVFQVVGTAGVLAFTFASFPGDLWFQEKRRAMVMCLIDGVVLGLIAGAIFAWLWPR